MQLKGPVCKIYDHLVGRNNIVSVNPRFPMAVAAAVMSEQSQEALSRSTFWATVDMRWHNMAAVIFMWKKSAYKR